MNRRTRTSELTEQGPYELETELASTGAHVVLHTRSLAMCAHAHNSFQLCFTRTPEHVKKSLILVLALEILLLSWLVQFQCDSLLLCLVVTFYRILFSKKLREWTQGVQGRWGEQ